MESNILLKYKFSSYFFAVNFMYDRLQWMTWVSPSAG
jgi:hypothetical protein